MRVMPKIVLGATALGFVTPLLVAPAPAAAETSLGGYTAVADAAIVRIGIYEPALPIPAEPQIDASIGYARSSTSTGPTSRALASYLWPGDTLGDGLGTLFGDESLDYPIKVNSKFPASDSAPAENAVQIADGNGMVTSADGTTTRSTVTGLQVGGNLVSGIGLGLCSLLLKDMCPDSDAGVPLPLPIAIAASMDASKSQSTVVLGDSVTSAARARATGLSLLGGLITIDGFDMDVTATSDGKTAKTDGSLAITGMKVAGRKVSFGDPIDVDGKKTELPKTPLDFPALGIKIETLHRTKKVEGASGSLAAGGLTITVDASVLSKQLKLGVLSDVLGPLIGDIPQLGPLLTGLLKLGTKVVITVGDVRVAASATPAYVGPPITGTGAVTPPATGPVAELPGIDAGLPSFPSGVPVPEFAAPQLTPTAPVAGPFQFPGLSQTPSLLLLAALALAGLLGWLFRTVGGVFFGVDDCLLGASVGVPNLREG